MKPTRSAVAAVSLASVLLCSSTACSEVGNASRVGKAARIGTHVTVDVGVPTVGCSLNPSCADHLPGGS